MGQSLVYYFKKHFVMSSLGVVLVVCSLWAFWFYRQNLRGASPALFGPSREVAALVERGESSLVYPPEFELAIFAEGLDGPRAMAVDPGGTLLVSLPSAGRVVALPDEDGNGQADRVAEVIGGLNLPHGLAFSPSGSQLYVAETDRVAVYEYDREALRAGAGEKIADLPGGGRHSTRSLLLMPAADHDQLLISVGSSCDTCWEEDWRRASILVADTAGGELRTFASGLRNAVFMTVHPRTGEIWATEMGRDYLGDDLPPDEINIVRRGKDYGWPSCYGDNVADTEFLDAGKTSGVCRDKTPSFIEIQAHSAPLGLDFFTADWPEKYRENLLVAYHGSWNRTVPTGYKVVLFRFDGQGRLLGRQDFISGWLLNSGTAMGRPVDISIVAGGRIYISDDKAGVIYRMTLKGE